MPTRDLNIGMIGRAHCNAFPTAPNFWLRREDGELTRTMRHICWDGCMFPNAVMEDQQTWNDVLGVMVKVRAAHGWTE
jgi:hypothetical protein